jgi:hypothetical protein
MVRKTLTHAALSFAVLALSGVASALNRVPVTQKDAIIQDQDPVLADLLSLSVTQHGGEEPKEKDAGDKDSAAKEQPAVFSNARKA